MMRKDKKNTTPLSPLPSGEGQGEGLSRSQISPVVHRRSTIRSKSLRQSQTEAEKQMWNYLRANQMLGYKFKRQMPIGPYFADFACVALKTIVEIDGGQHNENESDARRTQLLEQQGWKVIRFWNNDVLENIQGVVQSLSLTLSRREREFAKNTNVV